MLFLKFVFIYFCRKLLIQSQELVSIAYNFKTVNCVIFFI
jgi:hypothetical protein